MQVLNATKPKISTHLWSAAPSWLLSPKPSVMFTVQWFQDRLHTWEQNVHICSAEEMKLSTPSLEQLLAARCVHLGASGVQQKAAHQVFSWLQEDGFYLLYNTLFLQCWINCRFCLRHSRQGRVFSQRDDLETRQSQFWQYHGTYISRFTVWIITFFNFYQAIC